MTVGQAELAPLSQNRIGQGRCIRSNSIKPPFWLSEHGESRLTQQKNPGRHRKGGRPG